MTNIRGWDKQNGQNPIKSERSEALEKMGADAPRSSSGYLNSIIMIIMVTAAINANDRLDLHSNILKSKNFRANRG